MNGEAIANLAVQLMRFRSLSGSEHEAVAFLAEDFRKRGWSVEHLAVVDGRENLFVAWGTPRIVFTTHIDIVSAPDALFEPQIRDGRLFGRGACDAKGIIAAFVATCEELLTRGETDFGLLIVVGEEQDGIGAKMASASLANRGIAYLVDGEPTEGVAISAHKGGLGVHITVEGRACHSGYPELGDDANTTLVELAHDLLHTDFGYDSKLGRATINVGKIEGGVADNVISPHGTLNCLVRTVGPTGPVLAKIREIVADRGNVEVLYDAPAVKLMEIPTLPTKVASFGTDIPHFAALGAQAVLYGPGSILVAHTDEEQVSLAELESARDGYLEIFTFLKTKS
ncbi:MAG: M20/M25/M40 family metallo-hydrolase [Deltaproteobacteria bacterium]|nr:M20/M25/M40 family metallo-hydrolase [Deltaproteobacteria bacterium]